MIDDIDAKINFSDKDKTILTINHNYYVRTAIATLSDMFLTFLILLIIAAVNTFVGVMIGVSMEGKNENMSSTILAATLVIDGALALFYLIYVIAKIARVSKMRKHANRIEKKIIEKSTVSTKAETEAE